MSNVRTFAFNDAMMDQFYYAGIRFKHKDGNEYRLVDAKETLNAEDILTSNYDVLLLADQSSAEHSRTTLDLSRLLGSLPFSNGVPKIVSNARPAKVTQSIMFKAIKAHLLPKHPNLAKMITIDTWATFNISRKFIELPLDKTIVMKADDGARGIGQIVFDPSKVKIADINAVFRNTSDDLLVREKINDLGAIYNVADSCLQESNARIREDSNHYQELITDIESEYRILAHKGGIYFVKRLIKEGAYPQAVGANLGDTPQQLLETTTEIPLEVSYVVAHLLKIAPVMSLDLFIRKDGTWGFFEFCNQFGMEHLPHVWRKQFMQDAIVSLF